MDVREKLVELIEKASYECDEGTRDLWDMRQVADGIADFLIANGVTVQEWMSVSEPPKEKGVYIVTVKHWLDGKPVTREAKWNGADWLSCYKAEEITPRVTHWTYLPQPPKGE